MASDACTPLTLSVLTSYIGRFAPSPTGPLHMGSLVTALASWVDARQHGGQWLLRVEDIDPPREVAGATDEIIAALDAHGLYWDGHITYQHARSHHYEAALDRLRASKQLYACECTRKQLRAVAAQSGDAAYPGTCSALDLEEQHLPLRLRVADEVISFTDLHAGAQLENVAGKIGDFIIKRRDFLYAYQLAVVVDDALQHVTHVVRGADLLDNSPRQIVLQRMLGYTTPEYLHLPLISSSDGKKLSKQTGAQALDNSNAVANLQKAWSFLGQSAVSATSKVSEFLSAAVSQWQRRRIPGIDTQMFHI